MTNVKPPPSSFVRMVQTFGRVMVVGAAIGLFGLAIGIAIGGPSGITIAAISLGVGWILFFVGMREYKRGRRMIAENDRSGQRPPG